MDNMQVQSLINSGMAWRLEGSIGRACMSAIECGAAILGRVPHSDYYGNYVPSRWQVQKGSKGSVQYANRLRKEYGFRPLRGIDFDNGFGGDIMEEWG